MRVDERYDRVLMLVRWRGRPVGRLELPVIDGAPDCEELAEALVEAAGLPLRRRWLDEYLEVDREPDPDRMPSATVAVCTRDRPDDLRRCLEGMMKMRDDGQEYLVVDNCPSTDETERVVADFDRVRYVREDLPGLNTARNCALREARHDVVAFCDDDAVPDPNWLAHLLPRFDHDLVLCVTGLTMPLELETAAQEWQEWHSTFSRGFHKRVFDSARDNPMFSGQVGAGVNMAVRKSVLEMLGPFDEALDAGTRTCSGGDNEMFGRILSAGYRVVYEPAALSWHRHRRSWDELYKAAYGYGVGVYAAWTRGVFGQREFGASWVAFAWFTTQLKILIRSILGRPDSPPLRVIVNELRGCAVGPLCYVLSRRDIRRRGTPT